MDTRDSKGRFLPGSAGNPKGRPRKKPTAKEIFGDIVTGAATRLIDLIHSDDEAIAIRACIAVLDFALSDEKNSKFLSNPDKFHSVQEFQKIWEKMMAEVFKNETEEEKKNNDFLNINFVDVTSEKTE